MKPEQMPTNESIEIAARVWCDRDMSNIVMDIEAALKIASIIDEVLLHSRALVAVQDTSQEFREAIKSGMGPDW